MKKLIAVMMLCWASLVMSQETQTTSTTSTTPNLINPTNFTGQDVTGSYGWVNIREVYGCCTGGPGALVDTAGDLIWFSWGQSTVGQSIGINQVLSGTGLRINGFNYSYYWYNYGYNSGTLSSSITLSDNAGKTLESYYWSHPAHVVDGWQLNAGTKTFSSPYSLASLGDITMSFTGKDDRFWAGYYGPAIAMPRLSLNYDVDPCVTDPLSSGSCPGFAAALAKLTAQPALVDTTQTTQQVYNSEPVRETTTTVTTSPVTVATIAPSTVETATTTGTATTNSSNDSRGRTTNVNAVEIARSVNNAVAAQTQSIVSQSIQQSISVESSSDQTSVTSDINSTSLGSGLTVSNSTVNVMTSSQNVSSINNDSLSNQTTTTSLNISSFNTGSIPGLEGPMMNNNSSSLTSSSTDTSNPTSTFSLSTMSNRVPMNFEAEQNISKENVKTNVEPIAEFSTGVDARQLQVVPIGFSAYLTTKIQDVSFYAPREIYKGQNNVDNTRALRQLASDRLHEEMVNQQYKR